MKNRICSLFFILLTAALFVFSSCVDLLYPPQELLSNLNNTVSKSGGFRAPAWMNIRQLSENEIQIEWEYIEEADYYVIERSPPPEGTTQQGADPASFARQIVYSPQFQQPGNEEWGPIGTLDNTPMPYFNDNNVKPGYEYQYRVSSYSDAHGGLSEFTETPASVTILDVIVEASRYAYIPEASANDAGVYPVKISWKKPNSDDITSFRIERSDGSGFSPIAALGLNAPVDTEGFYYFIDENEFAQVGKKYDYRVCFLNNSKDDVLVSAKKTGWGALTPETYLIEYNKVMNTALGRLTYMYKTPDTSKIGTETKNGGLSGTIYYKASLVSLGLGGAEILIQLTNYCDFYVEGDESKDAYFILNGNSDTKTSMSAAGNMRGTMNVTGMYPGTVVYGTVWSTTANPNAGVTISGGKAAGGFYVVTPQGLPGKNVPWNQSIPEPGMFMATAGFDASDPGIEASKKLPWLNW